MVDTRDEYEPRRIVDMKRRIVDADTWAESGGTAGMFRGFRVVDAETFDEE